MFENDVSFIVELNQAGLARSLSKSPGVGRFLSSLPATVAYFAVGPRLQPLGPLRPGEPPPAAAVMVCCVVSFQQISCARAAQLLFTHRNGALADFWKDGAVANVWVLHDRVISSWLDSHFWFADVVAVEQELQELSSPTSLSTAGPKQHLSPVIKTPLHVRSPTRRYALSPSKKPRTGSRSSTVSDVGENKSDDAELGGETEQRGPKGFFSVAVAVRYFGQQTALYLAWSHSAEQFYWRIALLGVGYCFFCYFAAGVLHWLLPALTVGRAPAALSIVGVTLFWCLQQHQFAAHFANVRLSTSYLLQLLRIPAAALAEGHRKFHPAHQFLRLLGVYAAGGALLTAVLHWPLARILPDSWSMAVSAKISELLLGMSTVEAPWDLAAQQTAEPLLIVGKSVSQLRSRFDQGLVYNSAPLGRSSGLRKGSMETGKVPSGPSAPPGDDELIIRDPSGVGPTLTIRAAELRRAQWLHRVVAFNLGAYLQEPAILVAAKLYPLAQQCFAFQPPSSHANPIDIADTFHDLHIQLAFCALRLGFIGLLVEIVQPLALALWHWLVVLWRQRRYETWARPKSSSSRAMNSAHGSLVAQWLAPRYFLYYGGATDDFLDATTRFAFICLFGTLSPVSCVILFAVSALQRRWDRYKLCHLARRSLPEYAGVSHFAWLNFHRWIYVWGSVMSFCIICLFVIALVFNDFE